MLWSYSVVEQDFFISKHGIIIKSRNKVRFAHYYAGIAHYILPAHTIKIVMRRYR